MFLNTQNTIAFSLTFYQRPPNFDMHWTEGSQKH